MFQFVRPGKWTANVFHVSCQLGVERQPQRVSIVYMVCSHNHIQMPRQIHSINSSRTRTHTHIRINKMISLNEIRTHIQSPTCDCDQLTTEFLCFVCVCEAKRAAESEQHRWTITTNERSKECEMCLCMSACVRLSPNQSRYAPIGLRTSSAVFLRKPKCKHTLTAQFLSRGLHVCGAKNDLFIVYWFIWNCEN